MRGLWTLLLLCVTVSGQTTPSTTSPLRCRRCIGASSLDDCTFSVPCPAGEVCYMDEVLTEQLTIAYNGGCRPRDVCSRSGIGKRDGNLVVCTRCCDEKKSPECNTRLCAIKSGGTTGQCYHCAKDGSGGSGVRSPDDCHNLVSCQSDEMCGAETFQLSSHETYEFRCLPNRICTLLTVQALKAMDACRQPGADPAMCLGGIGKRQSGFKTCTACCGDSQCNSGSCENTIARLYYMWKGGVLDLNTLRSNATVLTTPASG